MNILDVSQLQKAYGNLRVLDDVTFTLGDTEKVGLIGRNGSGKTTLFRLVAGLDSPDGGEVSYRRGATLGFLPQEPRFDRDGTVSEEIEAVLAESRGKRQRYQIIGEAMGSAPAPEMESLLREQEALGDWLDHHQGWQTDHRVDEVLSKLGLPDRDTPISVLSGGMKKRVALAKLMLQSPDLLFLDEPTNHLDTATTEWLEHFLIGYPGAVMLITHDRYFLDRIAQRIFELEEGKLYSYVGGYTDYLEGREARLVQEGREQGRLITLLRRESAWMARGPKARQTKQKARVKRYDALQEKRKDRVDRSIGLRLHTDRRLGDKILELIYLSKSFHGRLLIEGLSLDLKAGDRIGIIGSNGIGKTTLLRMILGEEHPSSGQIVRGKNTRIAYFDQHRESLDPGLRVEEVLGEGYWVTVGGERRHKTGYLEEFLFGHSDQKRYIRTLSGGEKARLILARMVLEEANVLVLDEPTNDLDIPTLQLFDDALSAYNGCVLMVTHDRFFLDKVATGILAFEGEGRIRFFEGNYEAYRERMSREGEAHRARIRSSPVPRETAPESLPKARRGTGLGFKERQELDEIERAIEQLEERKRELERQLADPGASGANHRDLSSWGDEIVAIEQALSDKISRWEVLEARRQA